jgi:hypothetical protein
MNHRIIKVQKIFRGFLTRKKTMPLILYRIKKYLETDNFNFSTYTEDGRLNSSLDEIDIIEKLINKFGQDIIQKAECRMWYDMKVYDNYYGWIPVNIKSTTMNSNDNTGNLAMCVYAYTNVKLDLDKKYSNGEMSNIFFNKIKEKEYNTMDKKDYFFLILNKTNQRDVIINSVKGLSVICPNSNNLPFQICWDKNRIFKYEPIDKKIEQLISILKKTKPSWKENFMENMRSL